MRALTRPSAQALLATSCLTWALVVDAGCGDDSPSDAAVVRDGRADVGDGGSGGAAAGEGGAASAVDAATVDAASPDAAVVDAFAEAGALDAQAVDAGADAAGCGRAPFPSVAQSNPIVLGQPQCVTITYPGYEFRAQVEAFGRFAPTSSWIASVGGEYGVGQGTPAGSLELASPPPPALGDSDVKALLAAHIADGSLPAPSSSDRQLVFLLYLPPSTTATGPSGIGASCTGWSGYHSFVEPSSGTSYFYAVVADCNHDLDSVTLTASHELIEAATDPFGSTWQLAMPPTSPWWLLDGQEVADLCASGNLADYVRESGYVLARVYSNRATATCGSPCSPTVPGTAYVNVAVSPSGVPSVPAGGSATFTLTGWSTGAGQPSWPLSVARAPSSQFDASPQLGATTIADGTTTTLVLSVPAGTPSGRVGGVLVYSGPPSGGVYWPVAVVSQ